MKKSALALTLIGLLVVSGSTYAQQQPTDNVSRHRHPNLAAAQRLSTKAYEKITAAQQANEFDMEGHAAKAKDLLDQVNKELAAAAGAANMNKGKQ